MNLWRCCYNTGEYDRAIAGLVKVETHEAEICLDLAIAYQLKGDHETAKQRWEKSKEYPDYWANADALRRLCLEVLKQRAEQLIFGQGSI